MNIRAGRWVSQRVAAYAPTDTGLSSVIETSSGRMVGLVSSVFNSRERSMALALSPYARHRLRIVVS